MATQTPPQAARGDVEAQKQAQSRVMDIARAGKASEKGECLALDPCVLRWILLACLHSGAPVLQGRAIGKEKEKRFGEAEIEREREV
jgi:hypothetical protein